MMSPRNILAIAGLVVILGAANFVIGDRQAIVDSGQTVLLELGPVDPRSLMQGDYMILRYHDKLFPPREQRTGLPRTGAFVIRLDEHNVGEYKRVDDGSDLAEDEVLLQYKLRDKYGRIRLGAESYFFQEGSAQLFNEGRYGVLHVDSSGKSVLVGLADATYQPIKPPEN